MTLTLAIRTGEDVLAAVPMALGFHPENSVVMMAFGGVQQFHARVDHPAREEHEEVVRALVSPALQHGATSVIFVHYCDDAENALEVDALLRAACDQMLVHDSFHAHGGTYASLATGEIGDRHPYDLRDSELTVRGALAGLAPRPNREAIRDALAPAPNALTEADVDARVHRTRTPEALRRAVAAHVLDNLPLDDDALVALLRDLQHPNHRDAAWCDLTRADARAWVEFWTSVVRRSPKYYRAPAALILGLAAWLTGDGALAWVAHDLSGDDARFTSMRGILYAILESATPPSRWAEYREAMFGEDA